MIKIIISITVILISALCGNEFYKQKREKVMAIQELSRIVENIIISIDYLSLDVYEICKRVFINRNHLDYSSFMDIESGDFPLMWENACKASLSEIPFNIRNKFIETELKNNYLKENLLLRQYTKPKYNLTVQEFFKHCEQKAPIDLDNI